MARHRSRQNATHYLTATRNVVVDEGDLGDPIHEDQQIVDREPVEFDANTASYTRSDSGERVDRAPTVRTRGALANQLREGDVVDLEAMDPDARSFSDLEITSVEADRGRRARAQRATIELRGI